jgi:hypothetical protein
MLRVATQLILPASALGLPSVALPMGIADGLPVGIQVLSDLWREDLCLEVAELVECGAWTCRPIDPRPAREDRSRRISYSFVVDSQVRRQSRLAPAWRDGRCHCRVALDVGLLGNSSP